MTRRGWGAFPGAFQAIHPLNFSILSESTPLAHVTCTVASLNYGEVRRQTRRLLLLGFWPRNLVDSLELQMLPVSTLNVCDLIGHMVQGLLVCSVQELRGTGLR